MSKDFGKLMSTRSKSITKKFFMIEREPKMMTENKPEKWGVELTEKIALKIRI